MAKKVLKHRKVRTGEKAGRRQMCLGTKRVNAISGVEQSLGLIKAKKNNQEGDFGEQREQSHLGRKKRKKLGSEPERAEQERIEK